MSIISAVLGAVKTELPQFNRDLLISFRERQINESDKYIEMVYTEALKLLEVVDETTGEVIQSVKLVSHRLLTPEERVMLELNRAKNRAKTVDITRTDLNVVKYTVEFEGQLYHSYMFLPFLKDHAITISGSKYYPQLVIADTLFFHIADGIGIKVLRAPINFWRRLKYVYTDTEHRVYTDDVITTKVHLKTTKTTKKDLHTTLLLYILIHHGFHKTLELFGISPGSVQFTQVADDDPKFRYFRIRGVCDVETENVIPTAQELMDSADKGFFLKVDQRIFEEGTQVQRRVITSLLYNLQYFEKCNSSIYKNNQQLIESLYNEDVIYKVILGKTIFGMQLEKETQAHNHAQQHWSSLDESYLDKLTQNKLARDGIHCQNIHDLFVYVFNNIDAHIVNHSPMNLYGKRIAVNDILLSGIVQALFRRVYSQTKHKRPITPRDLASTLRAGTKEITKIFKHSTLIRTQPQIFNDSAILTILAKKNRATGSGSVNSNNTKISTKKPSGGKQRNIAENPDYWADVSMYAVESTNSNPTTNPGVSGVINPYAQIDPTTGIIVRPDYALALDNLAKCLSTK